jgi:hypothetical protein
LIAECVDPAAPTDRAAARGEADRIDRAWSSKRRHPRFLVEKTAKAIAQGHTSVIPSERRSRTVREKREGVRAGATVPRTSSLSWPEL